MAKLIIHCDYCKKPLEQSATLQLSETDYLVAYKCGHSYVEHKEPKFDVHSIDLSSLDGRHLPRGYQYDGIQFIVDSGFNCIIGDKQRLGHFTSIPVRLKNCSIRKFLNGRPCLNYCRRCKFMAMD